MDLNSLLQPLISGEITDDPHVLDTLSKDASIFTIKPQLVISPKNSQDISSLVSFINSHPDLHLSLTPRAAGTDMSGGAINESIILDLMKHFNQIQEITSEYVSVQPGVYYRDLEATTLAQNLLMPIYPASKGICAVGGMVANNAGGELNLAYGSLKDFVLELSVVLADGKEYLIKPLTQSELNQKLSQKDFEGQIYSKVFQMLTKNQELISSSKPQVTKNSTGYFLWDIWDGKTFDLTKLFLGSQGTLGIITNIKLKLIKPKLSSALLLITLPSFENLDKIVNKVLEFKPEKFECFDDETFRLALSYSSELIKDFKHNNSLVARWKFLSLKVKYLFKKVPQLFLLADFTGENQDEALAAARSAQSNLQGLNLTTSVLETTKNSEIYWVIRHKSFNLLRNHAQDSQAAAFIDDIIVKPEYLPEFLPQLNQILAPYKDKMHYTFAGHVGDGNFHIIPLMKLSDPNVRAIIPEVMEQVFSRVFKYHGSMSAEHNDGLIRGPFLNKMYSPAMVELFSQTKKIFDPNSIFNPHKKTEATNEYSLAHLRSS